MPYQDINKNPLPPARNPYVSSGSAMSVVDRNYAFPAVVHTKFINDLLDDVKQSLKLNRPIKLFFVGDYGYGKTTLLNLIAREFRDRNGLCIPIKFQELVTPVAASSPPDKHFESLLGAILTKMYNVLAREGVLTKQDAVLFDQIEYVDLFDGFYEMLNRAQRHNILLAFDEVESLFSVLKINISYFTSFLHSLSEKFSTRPGWGLCVCMTQEYYSQVYQEARQLPEARFNFKILNPLLSSEVKEYIETKNSSVTLRVTDKVYPFENEVIDFVAVVSGGIPRYVETICQLLWAEAESRHEIVSIETARRIFSNSYRVYASAYFSNLRKNFEFSAEAEAFLNLLFFSGGRRKSLQELVPLKNLSPISYFHSLSDKEAEYRLKKASEELRKKSELELLDIFGQRPYRYTLANEIFKTIFNAREGLSNDRQ